MTTPTSPATHEGALAAYKVIRTALDLCEANTDTDTAATYRVVEAAMRRKVPLPQVTHVLVQIITTMREVMQANLGIDPLDAFRASLATLEAELIAEGCSPPDA